MADLYGRKIIYTDEKEITSDNIIKVLNDAIIQHSMNADKIEFLLNYEAGNQPLQRVKTYRSDIDCICEDNIANEITEFKLGFVWGNPISLIRRGDTDSNKKTTETDAINLLNEQYEAENMRAKMQKIARYVEICGIGYELIDIKTDWQEGDSYFDVVPLDPRYSFVVRSNYYVDQRIVLGVTYRVDSMGNRYYTAYTNTTRFEVVEEKVTNGSKEPTTEWNELSRSGEVNPLGTIPIIEWERSFDRMGCFERQISEMDNLNILVSDFVNDVDQNTQAVWHGNDIEFPMDEEGHVLHPGTNDWVLSQTTENGRVPFLKPLSVVYDYGGMLNNIVTRRTLILEKCNVPQRNDNSGGSTGIAMSDATGWSSAEMAASKQQALQEMSKMKEVYVVLKAIKRSPYIEANNILLDLRHSDIQPNIKRQKTYELTNKANTYATLVSHGIDGLDALKVINLFDDPNQVFADSKKFIEAYQDSVFNKGEDVEGRHSADNSDQNGNSPVLDKV
jgi:SPP1 family phage portal protein